MVFLTIKDTMQVCAEITLPACCQLVSGAANHLSIVILNTWPLTRDTTLPQRRTKLLENHVNVTLAFPKSLPKIWLSWGKCLVYKIHY